MEVKWREYGAIESDCTSHFQNNGRNGWEVSEPESQDERYPDSLNYKHHF